jgi:hypothetical protein
LAKSRRKYFGGRRLNAVSSGDQRRAIVQAKS